MKRMSLVLAMAIASTPGIALGGEGGNKESLYVPDWSFRAFAGAGEVFAPVPHDDPHGANVVLTSEIGYHLVGPAFVTGLSLSTAADVRGLWFVAVPGFFGQIDLTYLLTTGLRAYDPPSPGTVPFLLLLGTRLGLATSQSTYANEPNLAPYTLVRPELGSYAEIDLLFGRKWGPVLRGTIDTSVNLETAYRWNVSAGFITSWGKQ
jgi:hypothetical protein